MSSTIPMAKSNYIISSGIYYFVSSYVTASSWIGFYLFSLHALQNFFLRILDHLASRILTTQLVQKVLFQSQHICFLSKTGLKILSHATHILSLLLRNNQGWDALFLSLYTIATVVLSGTAATVFLSGPAGVVSGCESTGADAQRLNFFSS